MSNTNKNESRPTSRRDMAVAVAKDVIQQLTMPDAKIVAGHDGFVASQAVFTEDDMLNKDLQDVLPLVLANGCTVCARGAALLSKARLFDKVPLNSCLRPNIASYYSKTKTFDFGVYRDATDEGLEDVFTAQTRHLMECAYECDAEIDEYKSATPLSLGAAIFGMNFEKSKDRMIAIMENIIQNNGKFIVGRGTFGRYWEMKDVFAGQYGGRPG